MTKKKDIKKGKPNPLPFMGEVVKTPDMLADEYLSTIMSNGFVGKHKIYLENYINADMAIALSHIKNSYKTYVIDGNWSKDKYETVLEAVIAKRWFLSTTSFLKLGIQFDEGKLIPQISSPTFELTDAEILEALKNNY